MRATAFLAMAILLAASAVGAAPTVVPAPKPAARVARVVPPAKRALTTARSSGRVDAARAVGRAARADRRAQPQHERARHDPALRRSRRPRSRRSARVHAHRGQLEGRARRRERRRRAPRSARRAARDPRRVSLRRRVDLDRQRHASRRARQARHRRGARLLARRREGAACSRRTCGRRRARASASTRTRRRSTSTSTFASTATTGSTARPRASRGASSSSPIRSKPRATRPGAPRWICPSASLSALGSVTHTIRAPEGHARRGLLVLADAVDDARDRLGIEEQRVVASAREDDHVAAREHRALARNDQRVRLADDGHVRDVVLVRARAEASEGRARSVELGADEETERTRALGAAERAAERDRLRDARMAAELLDVPARDETAEAVTDEVHAAARPGSSR